MFPKLIVTSFAIAVLSLIAFSEAAEGQDKKKRTGTVTGELKSRKDTPNGKNVLVEILGVGEEKERTYRVGYDPKAKAPIADVLEKVKAAKIGDRVRIDWVEGEGFNITAFHVLKKTDDKK